MKLSRVINSLDQVPEAIRAYYLKDDNDKYSLQVEGMVPKKEIKQFRDTNIDLMKSVEKLEKEKWTYQEEILKLQERIKSGIKQNKETETEPEIIKTGSLNYFTEILNTYKQYSILKSKKRTENTLRIEQLNKNYFIIGNMLFAIKGRFLKTGSLRSESYIDIDEPELIIDIMRKVKPGIDIFTFIQSINDKDKKYDNTCEMDNLAAIPITTYEHWWNNQIKDKTRNLIRKSKKNNVSVKHVPLNDELIKGIQGIFNETPVRQGRLYPHYGKKFDEIKKEISTYEMNSDFIGAYFEGELIGFIKIVYNRNCASLMQILSMIKHRDKAPTNALLDKTVELCADNKIDYLIYRKFIYGKKGVDELTEFKINNGFIRFDIPRYFIPVTLKGRIALFFNLHKNLFDLIPTPLYSFLLKLRSSLMSYKLQSPE